MPTIKSDIRISVRRGDKATRRIELILLPFSKEKYWIKIDGKKSQKMETATITQVTNSLREWLCSKT